MSGMDQQQPQDPSPMQVALVGPPDASTTVMPSAAPQPEVPSVRSVETTSTPAPPCLTPARRPHRSRQHSCRSGMPPDGAQRLTVRLDPPELGQVQIKIDRPSDAPARVEITVQKQETLTLLLRDQPQLQRALDQAGVPADGRTVTFHIAASGPSMRTDAGTTPVPGYGGWRAHRRRVAQGAPVNMVSPHANRVTPPMKTRPNSHPSQPGVGCGLASTSLLKRKGHPDEPRLCRRTADQCGHLQLLVVAEQQHSSNNALSSLVIELR